ncbi:hypothetical protein AS593_22385 [Caulobacter vibrioides]|nr:hypothetical protein AS593_22385 [Caulobacter vibrioides]
MRIPRQGRLGGSRDAAIPQLDRLVMRWDKSWSKNVLVVDIYAVIYGVLEVIVVELEPLPIAIWMKISMTLSVADMVALVRALVTASAVFRGGRVELL